MKRSTVVGYSKGSGIGDNPSVGLLVGGVQCGHVACGVCGAVGVWWGFIANPSAYGLGLASVRGTA